MGGFNDTEQAAIDRLIEAYYTRHGAAIDLIKAEVGDGHRFENAVARAVVSPRGAWCELIDLPVEFSGIAGPGASHRFVGDAEAIALVRALAQCVPPDATKPTALVDILALYSASGLLDRQDVFLWRAPESGDASGHRRTVGAWRPNVLPLFLRARLNGRHDIPGIEFERGVVAFLADVGDLHLVLCLPHEGRSVHDLGAGAERSSPQ
jgi:hypothetical protein